MRLIDFSASLKIVKCSCSYLKYSCALGRNWYDYVQHLGFIIELQLTTNYEAGMLMMLI